MVILCYTLFIAVFDKCPWNPADLNYKTYRFSY